MKESESNAPASQVLSGRSYRYRITDTRVTQVSLERFYESRSLSDQALRDLAAPLQPGETELESLTRQAVLAILNRRAEKEPERAPLPAPAPAPAVPAAENQCPFGWGPKPLAKPVSFTRALSAPASALDTRATPSPASALPLPAATLRLAPPAALAEPLPPPEVDEQAQAPTPADTLVVAATPALPPSAAVAPAPAGVLVDEAFFASFAPQPHVGLAAAPAAAPADWLDQFTVEPDTEISAQIRHPPAAALSAASLVPASPPADIIGTVAMLESRNAPDRQLRSLARDPESRVGRAAIFILQRKGAPLVSAELDALYMFEKTPLTADRVAETADYIERTGWTVQQIRRHAAHISVEGEKYSETHARLRAAAIITLNRRGLPLIEPVAPMPPPAAAATIARAGAAADEDDFTMTVNTFEQVQAARLEAAKASGDYIEIPTSPTPPPAVADSAELIDLTNSPMVDAPVAAAKRKRGGLR